MTEAGHMRLYGYFRSSATYRVRIALNLKGLAYNQEFLHLPKKENLTDAFSAINPQQLLPTLIDGAATLTQSLAIIEYLDETYPNPPLLPGDPLQRARVRALALAIACEIHPLNNLRVLRYLVGPMGLSNAKKDEWYSHWVETGLRAVEAMVAGHVQTGRFCHGDAPSLADVCLIPQLSNARRFNCDLSGCPTLVRIEQAALECPAFQRAAPENQPDAE